MACLDNEFGLVLCADNGEYRNTNTLFLTMTTVHKYLMRTVVFGSNDD